MMIKLSQPITRQNMTLTSSILLPAMAYIITPVIHKTHTIPKITIPRMFQFEERVRNVNEENAKPITKYVKMCERLLKTSFAPSGLSA